MGKTLQRWTKAKLIDYIESLESQRLSQMDEIAAVTTEGGRLRLALDTALHENRWAAQFTCPKCGPCSNATVTTKKTCLVCNAMLIRSKHPALERAEAQRDALRALILDRPDCHLCGRRDGLDAVVDDATWAALGFAEGDVVCLWCMDKRAQERGVTARVQLHFAGEALHGTTDEDELREARRFTVGLSDTLEVIGPRWRDFYYNAQPPPAYIIDQSDQWNPRFTEELREAIARYRAALDDEDEQEEAGHAEGA